MKKIHLSLVLDTEEDIDLFEAGKKQSGIKRNSDYVRSLIAKAGLEAVEKYGKGDTQ